MKMHNYYISYSHNSGHGFSTYGFKTKIQGPDSINMLEDFREKRLAAIPELGNLIILNWIYLGYFDKLNLSGNEGNWKPDKPAEEG